MFNIIPELTWMAVKAISLSIQGIQTAWTGSVGNPIAVIDTGGGPVFLSDPNKYVCTNPWPRTVPNPQWTADSDTCESIDDAIGVVIRDDAGKFA